MLLPSAFSCDSSQSAQPPLTRLQAALFASPPASPPHLSSQSAIGNIFSTCRSLQALLSPATPDVGAIEPITPPTSSHSQLPTPPLAHAPAPMKLRLRSHRAESTGLGITNNVAGDSNVTTRRRIVKRAPAPPPRGLHKRRRAAEEDVGRSDDETDYFCGESELDFSSTNEKEVSVVEIEAIECTSRPQTPKRARIAPEVLPLGLERLDFHSLHAATAEVDGESDSVARTADGTDLVLERDGEAWSTEDDKILVELVLEKLKLSKSEWQDCARSLGKDRGSVGRRWKSLVLGGDIGLLRRGGARRARIHGTWR